MFVENEDTYLVQFNRCITGPAHHSIDHTSEVSHLAVALHVSLPNTFQTLFVHAEVFKEDHDRIMNFGEGLSKNSERGTRDTSQDNASIPLGPYDLLQHPGIDEDRSVVQPYCFEPAQRLR
jgi:hypothetical protein